MLSIINRFFKFLSLLFLIASSLSAGGQRAVDLATFSHTQAPSLPKPANLGEYLARVHAEPPIQIEPEEGSDKVLMLMLAVARHLFSFSVPKPVDLAEYLSRYWPRENLDVRNADAARYAHQAPKGGRRGRSAGARGFGGGASSGADGFGSSSGAGGMGSSRGGGDGAGDDGDGGDDWRPGKDKDGAGEGRKIVKKRSPGKWTEEEDAELIAIVEAHGARGWKAIALELGGGRTDAQCFHRWSNILKPGLVKGAWTIEEDEIVRREVERHYAENGAGTIPRWVDIAKFVPGRIGQQVRERWINHLNPAVVAGEFSAAENEELLRLLKIYGRNWGEIAEKMPGRSPNACKNRFNSSAYKRGISGVDMALIVAATERAREERRAEQARGRDERLAAPAASQAARKEALQGGKTAGKKRRRKQASDGPDGGGAGADGGRSGGFSSSSAAGMAPPPPQQQAAWAPGSGPGLAPATPPRTSTVQASTQTGLEMSPATQLATSLVQNPGMFAATLFGGVGCPAGAHCPVLGGGDLGLSAAEDAAAVRSLVMAAEGSAEVLSDDDGDFDGSCLPPDGKSRRVDDSGAGGGVDGGD